MAQRISVEMIDDVNGKPADETVTFGLDGVTYEIDLTKKNSTELRAAIEPYLTAGRRVGGRRGRPATTKVDVDVDNRAVRAWAESNGYEVSGRGRISREIIEKYVAAGN
jgi:hypothetical protein